MPPGAKGESMKCKKVIGLLVALLAFAFFSVALVVSTQHGHALAKTIVWGLTSLSFAFGVVVVTYKYPVSGLTAPTAAQVYGLGVVTATVFMLDTDLTATVTHNFGLSAAELADLFSVPIVNASSGVSVFPGFTIARTANTVVLTKPSAVGSGGTFEVVILRPSTQLAGPLSGAR